MALETAHSLTLGAYCRPSSWRTWKFCYGIQQNANGHWCKRSKIWKRRFLDFNIVIVLHICRIDSMLCFDE